MSLINQMLKELDARRSDAGGGNPFGEQIRAVPERRHTHPAWWVALALGLSLIAVVGWVLTRPPAPDPYALRVQLPLKLEVDLGVPVSDVPAEASVLLPLTAAETPTHVSPRPSLAETVQPSDAAPNDVIQPAPENLKAASVSKPVSPPAPAARKGDRPNAGNVAARLPADKQLSRLEVLQPDEPFAKQVRKLSPQQRAENTFREATLAIQQGRRSEALLALEQVLQLDPKHVAARQTLIGVLLDMKRSDEALIHARTGLELDQRQIGLAMILARLQVEKKELRAAIDTLEHSRQFASERADYLAFLAALLQRDEQHAQASDLYLLALKQSPHNGVWWMGLGISLQAEHRNSEAGEAYNRAKDSNSLSPELLAFVDQRLRQLR